MTATRSRQRQRVVWIVIAVAVAAIAVMFWQLTRSDTEASSPAGGAPEGVTASSGVLIGDREAPVTVDVYADPQCPACAAFEEASGDVLAERVAAGDINVRYHVITFLDSASTNEYSSRAASASYCAARSPRYYDYIRALYAQQPAEGGPGHDNETLADMGEQVGVSEADFRGCVLDERYTGFAVRATEAANDEGIASTPTVLIDGEQLDDWSPQNLEAAIDAA